MVRKTALGLLLAGCLFIFFRLMFADVDLLIDAVGFIIVFNGAKALKTEHKAFWPAALLALGLVPLSAAQLFVSGGALVVLSAVRLLAEAVMLMLLGIGLGAALRADGWHWDAMALRLSFWLSAVFSTVCAGFVVYTKGSPPPPALGRAGLVAHLLTVGALLHGMLLRGRRFSPRPGGREEWEQGKE